MKLYDIFLDNHKIGTTELENGDAPMGCVLGKITFKNISLGYDFFKTYCIANNIELVTDYPEDRLILTQTINTLEVKNEQGIAIKGIGNQISGIGNVEFEISIQGVPYPFYEEEFPHYVKAYDDQINNEQ